MGLRRNRPLVAMLGLLALLALGALALPRPLEVLQTSDVSALLPGEARALRGEIRNPNAMRLPVLRLEAEVSRTSDPACGPERFAIDGSPLELELSIPAGGAVGWAGPTVSLSPEAGADDACRRVTATIEYTVR